MSFIGDILGTNVHKNDAPTVDNPYDNHAIAQQQQDFANQLKAQAAGTGGPSAAEQQMKNAMNQNANNAYGVAASQRGVNPALAMRNAVQANDQAGLQAAGQTAAMRAQEQLNAQQQLGGQLNTMGSGAANYANMNLQGQMNNANNNQKTGGGLLGGIGALGAAIGLADGGEVPDPDPLTDYQEPDSAPADAPHKPGAIAQFLSGFGAGYNGLPYSPSGTPQNDSGAKKPSMATTFSNGYAQSTHGNQNSGINPFLSALQSRLNFKAGGTVPGHANVPGDSKANDTVPAMLSPGEIVVPRSKASDPEMAKDFIDHIMARKKAKDPGHGFAKVVEAHRKMTEALKGVGRG